VGASDNDTLNGGTGNDSMVGGSGDDLYFLDSLSDAVVEALSSGTDSVLASLTGYTLAANVEYLELLGTAVAGTGNALNNTLLGNAEGNSLDGGVGADTLTGGLGNDTYFVDNAGDVVTEQNGQGTDVVLSNINNHTLAAHVEGLILQSTVGVLNGTGNSLDNTLTGNTQANSLSGAGGNDTILGGEGSDTLNGGTGNDSLIGGADDDYYIIDSLSDEVVEAASAGTDSVAANVDNYTLADQVEYLLLGTGAITGTGNSLSNTIEGNTSNNSLVGDGGNDTILGLNGADTIDGGIGDDSMVGGGGSDLYYVDSAMDAVVESGSGGTDSVISFISTYTLTSNVEHLILDTGAVSGTGNILNNSLIGNNDNNSLDGGAGMDTLIGADGNDTYFVDSLADTIVEGPGEGDDTVITSLSGYSLAADLEGLVLTGSAILGSGNAQANTLTGNTTLSSSLSGGAGEDTFIGGSGNDTLNGGTDADSMDGGSGNDYYIVDHVGDVISDSSGTDSVEANLSGGYTLGVGMEHLVFGAVADSGTGNGDNNSLFGNSLDNTLDGAAGANTLIGGLGNDYFIVNSSSDVVIELPGGGTDTAYVDFSGYTLPANVENVMLGPNAGAATLTGDSGNNSLTGNSLDNTLDGGAGADTLSGGLGNDFYIVDNLNDVVIENGGEGTDSVQSNVISFTLPTNAEYLTLGTGAVTGVGNGAVNTLVGNSTYNSLFGGGGNDSLSGGGGNDTINGGSGDDTMVGGSGNDYFVVDSAGDSLVGGGGSDGIISQIEGYILTAAFDVLVLDNGIFAGTGNAGSNSLIGNSLSNTLSGGAGEDTLRGRAGHDYYYVNSSGDVVIEAVSEGTDTVEFSGFATYTLPDHVDRLVLGMSAVDGYGNSLNNSLTGNADHNSLFGAAGRDSLNGGDGNDTLRGSSASTRNEIDTLTGGAGSNLFVLGNSSAAFYNDGLSSQVGTTDYAYITDFTPGTDTLQLKGSASSYYLGAHTVAGLTAHQGLFLESGSVDELIAIIQTDGAVLSAANTITNANFV
jgi:Ca2+-binding RTX toxin-like protein